MILNEKWCFKNSAKLAFCCPWNARIYCGTTATVLQKKLSCICINLLFRTLQFAMFLALYSLKLWYPKVSEHLAKIYYSKSFSGYENRWTLDFAELKSFQTKKQFHFLKTRQLFSHYTLWKISRLTLK